MHAAASRCRRQWFVAVLATACGFGLATPRVSRAQDVIKADNTDALNLTASWDGGVVPGASNVAVWDSTVGAANTSALGGSLSWQGIRIADPGGAITIANTVGTTLTLGSSGIDMSQATQNLTINPSIAIGANQAWTIAGGRTLTGIAGSTTSVGTGTGNIVMSQSGAGLATIIFNQNGNGTGWGGYSGAVTIGGNLKVQSQGNAAAAFGSGLLTLAGGTVAQNAGNWTWGNAIDVTSASVIGNDSSSGLGRTLKLLGDLSSSNGSGLTFINTTTGGTRTDNVGFLLAGQNPSTYVTTTISANSRVRVGGNATATVAGDGYDAGNRGSLGTGAVILEAATSELAFTRADAHTVANVISGLGTVVIGGTTTPLAATSTQVVTFTGANTYTGGTRISTGTLRLGGTGVLGGGSYAGAITANATLHFDSTANQTLSGVISGTGTLQKSNTGTLTLSGTNTYGGGTDLGGGIIGVGSDSALGAGTFTITGGTLRTSGTANRTLANDIVLAGSGAIASDSTSGQGMRLNGVISGSGDLSLTSASTGILTLAGNNTFTGATTVSSGYLAITNSALAESASVSLAGANTRLFVGVNGTTSIKNLSGDATASIRTDFNITGSDGARTLAVNQSIDGTYAGTFNQGGSRPISLEKIGVATLSLTNSTNAYTGSTTVSAGTLRVGGGGRINSGAYAGAISIAGAATLHHDSTAGQTFSGTISGGGTLQKSSTGVLQLTGANNSFSGLIDISSGDVVLNNAGSENGAPGVNMTGGRLILATPFVGGTATIGNLTGTAGTINAQFGADVGIRTLQVNQTTDGAFAGNLQDGGSGRDLALVKIGPATLTLSSGSNTYIGSTSIGGGTLLVNGSIASSSLTTVASSATLGGTGSVGATLIQGGGFHAPGTSPGIQTVTSGLEYQSNATLIWELFTNTTAGRGTDYDGVDLTGGSLVIDPGAILALDFGTLAGGSSVSWSNSFWGSDKSWTIINVGGTGTWNGSLFGSLSVGLDAFGQSLVSVRPDASFSVADVGGDLTLQYTPVPEPATLALAAAGGLAVLAAAARQRRR